MRVGLAISKKIFSIAQLLIQITAVIGIIGSMILVFSLIGASNAAFGVIFLAMICVLVGMIYKSEANTIIKGVHQLLLFIVFSFCIFFSIIAFLAITNHRIRKAVHLNASAIRHHFLSRNMPVNPVATDLEVLTTNTRLFIKYLLAHDFPQQPYQETIFGNKITFYSYFDLMHLVHELFVKKIYHFSTTNESPIILDCGSNLGLSIMYFKSIYPKAKIIGFEPDPATFKLLSKNIADNDFSDVTTHNKALVDIPKTIPFYVHLDTPGNACNSMFLPFYPTKQIDVEGVKLSDYITEPIDFLKLDIEGAEIYVLQELAHSGKLSMVQQMIFEFHPKLIKETGIGYGTIQHLLEKNGFKCIVQGEAQTPFSQDDYDNHFMVYAFRK